MTTTRTSKTAEITRLKDNLGRAHRKWITDNRSATLADLRQYLEDVAEEFQGYEEDALITDHFGELGYAADYLSEWGDPTTDGEEPVTFEYRLANVEEDIGHVDDLIELVGETFKVKNLRRNK